MRISSVINQLTDIMDKHGDLEFCMYEPEGSEINADYLRLIHPRDINKGWLEDKTKPPLGVIAEY